MKTTSQLVISALMCTLILIPSAYAEEQKSMVKDEMKGKGEKLFAKLNLSEEQKAQLKKNKEAQRSSMKASMEQMKAQREAMKQELMKPQLDMNKINAIQSQIKAAAAQMADNRLNSILEVRKILTPEQFSQFIGMMNDRFKNMEKNMDKRHFSDEPHE